MTNRSESFLNSCVIETGLYDFHKRTVTVLPSHLPKLGLQIIKYRCRDYKHFSNEKFRSQLNKECEKFQSTLRIDSFLNIFTLTQRNGSFETNYVRANDSLFMNKSISKTIKKETRLRNNFLKT